jgi:L,D-peptidoglycan transpeptidase YkuD (ErfK/YbiS/YcfS/YnhG family)
MLRATRSDRGSAIEVSLVNSKYVPTKGNETCGSAIEVSLVDPKYAPTKDREE